MTRRRTSPLAPKPLRLRFGLTPPVLNTRQVYPLLEVSPNRKRSDLKTKFFGPLRIIWV